MVSPRHDRLFPERLDITLAGRYHLTRSVLAASISLVSLVLLIVWGGSEALIVMAIAAGAAADARMRYRGRWSQSALIPLLIDSTAFGAAIVFGRLPLETVISPLCYVVVSAFALLNVQSAMRFLSYPVAWVIAHMLLVDAGGWSGPELWLVRAASLLTFLPGMAAILIAASAALQSAEQLDEKLVASERQLEVAITSAPLILFEYDAQGIFTLSEGAGLGKLGLTPGEVVGMSVGAVYADAPQILAGVQRSLQGESFSDVVQLGELFFQVSYSAQFDERGTLARVIGVATDVSERVAAEDALADLVRSKDEFVATIAHELRTPLTAVVGLSEELRSSHQAFNLVETEEFIGMIADQSHEVASIVEDLLVVARADIGKVTVVSQEVDLQRVVEGVLVETNHLRTSSTRAISLGGTAAHALADPQRVRQVLRNLVTNAFRYGGEEVWIDMKADGMWSRVVVADSGPGIPEPERETIFEPFRRAHNTPGRPGSLGLGLSVARKLAEMMDGTLKYQWAGERSEFVLALPTDPDH
jgi:signal transduction histidine kinase